MEISDLMKSIKFLWLSIMVSAATLFVACNQKGTDSEPVLVAPLNPTAPLNVDISEIVDSITYIPLETNDDCLMGDVYEAVLKGGYVFVQDSKHIYTFDGQGNFIAQIGRVGNGPGEYVNIDAFYVDDISETVGVVCGYKESILCYDFHGKYLRTLKMSKSDSRQINNISVLPDGRMVAHYYIPCDAFPNKVLYKLFTVVDDAIVADPLTVPTDLMVGNYDGLHPYIYYSMAQCQGKLYALSPVSLDIYCLGDDNFVPEFRVDMGKKLPDEDYIKDNWTGNVVKFMTDLIWAGKSPGLLEIVANGKYLFLRQDYNGDTLVWDGNEAILIGNVSHSEYKLVSGGMMSGISPEKLGHYTLKDSESNPVLYLYHFRDDLMEVLKSKIER